MASNPVVIGNSVPSLASVSLTPQPPRTADEIRCVSQGYADADGDPDQTWFAWTIDGQDAGSGDVLSQVPVKGQVVGCTATPNDGREDGSPVSNTAIVVNTPLRNPGVDHPQQPCPPQHAELWPGRLHRRRRRPRPVHPQLGHRRRHRQHRPRPAGTVRSRPTRDLHGVAHRRRRRRAHPGGTGDHRQLAPLVDHAAITPLPLYTETDALATASLTDLDGDPAFPRFTWLVDGIETTEVSSTLDHTAFVKGQEVVVGDARRRRRPRHRLRGRTHIVANSPPRLAVEILPPTQRPTPS